MPEVGHPESYYSSAVQRADRDGNLFAREAAKVGQYITLAASPNLDWPAKLRYFQHALHRHCQPPPLPDEEVWLFFRGLSDLVRSYAGHEALRLASAEDDHYAFMEKKGVPRRQIEARAEAFFDSLMGRDDRRAEWFTEEDWAQLRLIRDQWL
jgi:hypothetical protein